MEKKRTQQSGRREKKWEQAQHVGERSCLAAGAPATLDAAQMTMSMMAAKGS